ncbi:MAG TPA: response regulator [Burkholderiales bacterium]|nr:response regulator [Burkholderiales bacterium]
MTRESELRIVTDSMPAAAVHCARDQTFLWVNPRYASWMARPTAGIIGRKLGEVIGAEAMRAIEPYIERVLKGEQVQYERLARFAGLGERWLSWMYMPTYGAGREPDGWVAIGTDIHDRKLAEEALKAEHQRKDEFLAALAHELRNPLAPIRNAVAILARKGSQDPEVAWSQSVIERQVEQLSRLIGDLVDIERIARGKLALRAERVPLEAIVDMALESSRPHVNAAGHHLSVLLPSERAMIEGDPARLAQAFATLLKNAAKHTPAQGTITLSAAVEAGEVVVEVEDSGAGFDAATARRLFTEDAGVGLRLVQGIVGLHRGRIEARSAGPGRGAEFVIRLPLARGAAKAREPAGLYSASRPVRVLVADDNRDAADSLQRVLALYGHEVRVAYDGATALRIGQEFRPRVAVLDITMPGSDGYDVARAIRRQQGRDVTLVALTGWGKEADRLRAMESGFDYHLVKPIDPDALNQLLADVEKT